MVDTDGYSSRSSSSRAAAAAAAVAAAAAEQQQRRSSSAGRPAPPPQRALCAADIYRYILHMYYRKHATNYFVHELRPAKLEPRMRCTADTKHHPPPRWLIRHCYYHTTTFCFIQQFTNQLETPPPTPSTSGNIQPKPNTQAGAQHNTYTCDVYTFCFDATIRSVVREGWFKTTRSEPLQYLHDSLSQPTYFDVVGGPPELVG